jgi:transketolase
VAYSRLIIKIIGACHLFTGKSGATHQSDKELGFLLRVPNLTVIEPGFNLEMAQALRAGVETDGPFYFRVVRCEVEDNELFDGYQFKVGKGVTAWDEGTDVGLVTTGYMIKTAKVAAEKLKKQGIGVRIDHHPSLKPFDRDLLYNMAGQVSCIVTGESLRQRWAPPGVGRW